MIGDFSDKEDPSFVRQAKEIIANGLKTDVICKKAEALKFAYKSSSPKTPAEFNLVENEGFNYHTVEFKNGVKAHLKKNIDPRMPKKIMIKTKMSHGKWEYDSKDNAIIALGSSSLILGGTGKHPLNQVQSLLAGKDVSFSFTMNNDESYFAGQSSPEDFLHYLEWNRAYIDDPAFGNQSIDRQKYNYIQKLESRKNTYLEPLLNDYFKALYDDDQRFASLTENQINSAEEKDIKAWMKEKLLNRCPEFTIVGEIETEQAVQQLYQAFGDLKCKTIPAKEKIESQKLSLKPGVHKKYKIDSKDPQALVAFYWPTYGELKKNSILVSTLQNIIEDRARNLLREELSLAYTPQVEIFEAEYPWKNDYLYVGITTDPSQIETVLKLTPNIVKSFEVKPISEVELDRARAPVIEGLNLLKTSTMFWFNVIPVKESGFDSVEDAIQYLHSQSHKKANSIIKEMFKPECSLRS